LRADPVEVAILGLIGERGLAPRPPFRYPSGANLLGAKRDMLTKPWDQLSTDEKIDRLRQQIAEMLGKADMNVMIFNQQLAILRERIETLEKQQGQGGNATKDHRPDDT
jgi:hypothetical protein